MLEWTRRAAELVRQEYCIRVVPEDSRSYTSQSNGVVARAIWEVESEIRTLKFATEELYHIIGA